MIHPRHWHLARRLWIRAKRAVASQIGGSQRSLFRGSGLDLEEVRPYEPGDDVRTIDWNVTARMGQPFVKRYIEERELSWQILIDISGSMDFPLPDGLSKRELAAELTALAAAMALHHNDRVGMLLLTAEIEHVSPARRGGKAILEMLHRALFHRRRHAGTDLGAALRRAARILPRRSLVLLFSDFLSTDFRQPLRLLGRHHDLIAVRIVAPLESSWPAAGLMRLRDLEIETVRIVDSSAVSQGVRERAQSDQTKLDGWWREADASGTVIEGSESAADSFLELLRRHAGRRSGQLH